MAVPVDFSTSAPVIPSAFPGSPMTRNSSCSVALAWALILLPVVLAIIQRRAIEPEEAFLEKRFGSNYIGYKEKVRRWL
jgi:protein-S-isoprenylcysteine O-methyltransferase Ste14